MSVLATFKAFSRLMKIMQVPTTSFTTSLPHIQVQNVPLQPTTFDSSPSTMTTSYDTNSDIEKCPIPISNDMDNIEQVYSLVFLFTSLLMCLKPENHKPCSRRIIKYADRTILLLYVLLPVVCALYVSIDHKGVYGPHSLSGVVFAFIAGYMGSAVRIPITSAVFERLIEDKDWQQLTKEHFDFVWALVSSIVYIHLFS
jgi:hypothetical protein